MTERLRENETERRSDIRSVAMSERLKVAENCLACGAEIHRDSAKFCPVCGKNLLEDYQPLDAFRSSYKMQRKVLVYAKQNQTEEMTNLFEVEKNSVSQMAWASFVYSMLPYIGIVFVPLTFVIAVFGIFTSYQKPQLGGRKLALMSIGLSIIVLAIQILLWWLLYIIPTLAR
jgi:hypothetical protein